MMTYIKKLWIYFLVFYFCIEIAPGVEFEGDSIQIIVFVSSLYGLLMILLPKIIYFFKVNINVTTFFLFGSILTFLYLNLFYYLFFGILDFANSTVDEKLFGITQLQGYELSGGGIILITTLLTMICGTFTEWLEDNF